MFKAVQCPQCGAGVTSTDHDIDRERTCDYCGSVFRADIKLRQNIEEHPYLSPKHCPRCHHTTVETDVDNVYLRACHHCGGMWIPHKALRRLGRLSKRAQRNLIQLNRSRVTRPSRRAYVRHGTVRCPICARGMKQKVYSRGTTVTVDICAKHGAWFDENELMVAHKSLAKRMGLREPKYNRSARRYKFRGGWDYGSLYLLFKLLAEILDELFD